MKRAIFGSVAAVFILAGSGYAIYRMLKPVTQPEGILYGNGQIEGTEIRVSAEVTGRVIESALIEGGAVKTGEVLVRLDDSDLRARVAQAGANRKALEELRKGLRVQIATSTHHLGTAEADLVRYQKLSQTQVVPPQVVDQASDRLREAKGSVDTLQAQLAEAEARLDALARELDWFALQLDKTTIRAPVDGTVISKGIEVGELASPGRLIAVLVDLGQLELKVYVPERDYAKLKLGDAARMRVDAFPERYFEATVARIDQRAQFTPKDIHMPEERTRLVFGVTLRLSNPEGFMKPGMPADAWIKVAPDVAWPVSLVVPP